MPDRKVGKLFVPQGDNRFVGLQHSCSRKCFHSIYGFVFCLHRDRAYAPNNWQESEATDSNVPVENAPGYLASNPDFRLITFSEGSGFTLPAKDSCVGLRKSDTALLEQINEILGTLDNATRDEMWQTAVDNQPQ